jgi:small-conductance mechanosensitive channel
MKGLDKLIFRAAQKKGGDASAPKSYAKLAGDIVFWTILTFFLAASGNMLDWPIFSSIAKSLMLYLPNVISGLLIILVGFGLSGLTRSAVSSAIETAGIAHSDFLSRIAQITVVLTAIVIGVEQLGINLAFISTTLVVAAGVILGGGALAFALGAKYFVANVIGAQTTRKHYHVGQHIRFAEIEGYILEITATTLVVDTPKGRATIPASLIQRNICEIIDEE